MKFNFSGMTEEVKAGLDILVNSMVTLCLTRTLR